MTQLLHELDNFLLKRKLLFIVLSLFVVSASAMSYEYFLGAMASYLMGDGKVQWALTITAIMVGMGFGGYGSRFVKHHAKTVLTNELLIACVGGFSALLQYAFNVYLGFYQVITLSYIFLNGFLLGFQIPLFMHLVRNTGKDFKETIAEVTLFDFLGAIPAVLLYILLLSEVGMVKGPIIVALINMFTVFLGLRIFQNDIAKNYRRKITVMAFLVLLLIIGGLISGEKLVLGMEQKLYAQQIIYQEQTSFQRIVLTKKNNDMRLYLNGNLQFASMDEYRYHEALIHPAMSLSAARENILILGGGDGLALREIWKYPDVHKVTMVDIDPEMTNLGKNNLLLKKLNQDSMSNPRLKIINQDALQFLQNADNLYDVIIVDLPDPNNEALAKLYTKEFYTLIKNHLSKGGMVAIQSTSPFYARKVYWMVVHTVEASGLKVSPYHVYVPSFGDWGFTLAGNHLPEASGIKLQIKTKYLNPKIISGMFSFPEDEEELDTAVNTLIHPSILDLYQKAWINW